MKRKIEMTNQEILNIAMNQSAIDLNCMTEDFLQNENKIVISKKTKRQESIWNCHLYVIW